MNQSELLYWAFEGILRKRDEFYAHIVDVGEYLDTVLYGLYVIDKIVGDKTTASIVREMIREDVDKHVNGFTYAFLSGKPEYDFDVLTIEEAIVFLMLYHDVDMGSLGNVKKELIENEVRDWFRETYMELKWNDTDNDIWLFTLMSHVPLFNDLPLEDIRDSIYMMRINNSKSKPDWGLYWLTGELSKIREEDYLNYRAWIYWRSLY